MEKEALDKIEGLITTAMQPLAGKTDHFASPAIVLPAGCGVHDLERYLTEPAFFRGTFSTENPTAFCAYVNEYASGETAVFLEASAMRATAIIDFGSHDDPKWHHHRAQLQLQVSPEFMALRDNSGSGNAMGQRMFMDWLTDWSHILTFYSDSEGKHRVAFAEVVRAVQKMEIKAHANSTSEERDFAHKRSRLEEVEIEGQAKLPPLMSMHCEPYLGLEERNIFCRLLTVARDGQPFVGYRINGATALQRDCADELHGKLTDSLDATIHEGAFKGSY